MKKAMLTLVFGSAIFLAACGGGDDKETAGEATPIDGEAVAMKSCVMCHGGELKGAGAPAINDIGARLSEEEILEVIKNGKGTMPAVLKGEEDKQEAVAAWLATQK